MLLLGEIYSLYMKPSTIQMIAVITLTRDTATDNWIIRLHMPPTRINGYKAIIGVWLR